MPTNFPGAVDSYTTKVDGVSDVLAADINNVQDAIVAIQNRIGANASGAVITAGATQEISGLKTFTGGRAQVRSAGAAMWEMHIPNAHARGWYLDSAGRTRLSTTNGAGVASTELIGVDASGNTSIAGNFIASGGSLTGNASSATRLSSAGGAAPSYSARAWCSFDGVATIPGIIGAVNVSSVTRVSTGNYFISFTEWMQDGAGVPTVTSTTAATDGSVFARVGGAVEAGGFPVNTMRPGVGDFDAVRVYIAMFR
jgi:hypothetical protein